MGISSLVNGLFVCLLILMIAGTGVMAASEGNQSIDKNLTNNSVMISNFAFEPQQLNITMNTSVIWTNEDNAPHTIVTDKEAPVAISSEPFKKGETFEFNFTTAGSYPYHCGIHPSMTGVILVSP
jgi:plastocyanin